MLFRSAKEAKERGGEICVFAHVHPEGANRPTPDDRRVTEDVRRACRAAGIELERHYVISGTTAKEVRGDRTKERG